MRQAEAWDLKLDEQTAARIRQLAVLTPRRAFQAIVLEWGGIFLCLAAACLSANPLVMALAVLVLGTRQHALLILMHEGAHFRLVKNKVWNDRLSDALLALPVFVSTAAYRANHFAHHNFLNSDKDPDSIRKRRPDWRFPKSRGEILRILAKDMLGPGLINMTMMPRIVGPFGRELRAQQRKSPLKALPAVVYYGAFAALLAASGYGLVVLALWLAAWGFVLPVLMRLRSLAEHHGVADSEELNKSRTTKAPLWERLFIVPHHVHYHLDHHLFPAVAFYNLPKLHQLLMSTEAYRQRAHLSEAILSFGKRGVLGELLPREDKKEPDAGLDLRAA